MKIIMCIKKSYWFLINLIKHLLDAIWLLKGTVHVADSYFERFFCGLVAMEQ